MRVLALIPYPGIKGPLPKLSATILDMLRSRAFDVETEYWSRHADVESLLAKVTGRWTDLKRIQRRVRTDPPDVVFVTTAHDARALLRDVPLLLCIRRLVPAIVVQFHGSRSDLLAAPGHWLLKAGTRIVLRSSDSTLVLSTEEQREFMDFAPTACVRIARNPLVALQGSDFEGGVGELRERSFTSDRSSNPLTVLFVGRIMRDKGVFDLASAADVLRSILKAPFKVILAGEGPDAGELLRKVHSLGLQDCVFMAGHVNDDVLGGFYRSADVFVLPSYREGFPMAIAEALSFGLPIVTTRLRGMVDYLLENENAILVSPGEPKGLARALAKLLGDPELRRSMSLNNRRTASSFDPEVVAEDYVSVLNEVAEGHKPQGAAR